MSKIFISYRRHDSAYATGHIHEVLAAEFGRDSIFLDVDSTPLGVDFRKHLDDKVRQCQAFLAVIGPYWLKRDGPSEKDALADPRDFVRVEIESALTRDIPIIPLLVQDATMPSADVLPKSIEKFAYRNFKRVRTGPDFRRDMHELVESLKVHLRPSEASARRESSPFATETTEEKGAGARAPEGMVHVPKGPFLYGKQRICLNIARDYWIDIYPVTNEKYRAFVLAGGYGNREYWSEAGWKWRIANTINAPAFWHKAKWTRPDHPVVGVSFYEAEAYAKWAGKRLPTEQEWEKAARGTEGREYPWGDEFDANKCNSSRWTSFSTPTTPVTQYPNGVSPYGCYDMAGNVWEWTDSQDEADAGRRVIRGGSLYFHPEFLRSSFRCWLSADFRFFNFGFRLAQDVPK